MEMREGILTRRSIRQYIPGREIPQEDVEDILRMAMYAPSARNCQPWEFIVVKDMEMRRKVTEVHPYCSFLPDASLGIIVCGNKEYECEMGYALVDGVIAAENLLLGCHAKGLGACWCGIYPNESRVKGFSELFDLPDKVVPIALIVVGYPLIQPQQPEDSSRFRLEKIHYDHW